MTCQKIVIQSRAALALSGVEAATAYRLVVTTADGAADVLLADSPEAVARFLADLNPQELAMFCDADVAGRAEAEAIASAFNSMRAKH